MEKNTIHKNGGTPDLNIPGAFLAVFLSAIVIRILLACLYSGFIPDQTDMIEWGARLINFGPSRFYAPEVQMPYPPLYLWLLYLVSAVSGIDHIESLQIATFYLRLIPVIFDLATGVLIYAVLEKKKDPHPVLLSALYFLNPAIMFNSAIWGQTDACFMFFVALMCVFLEDKKADMAVLSFCAGCLIKQQTAVFFPVLIVAVVKDFLSSERKKNMMAYFRGLLWGFVMFLIVSVPFNVTKVIGCYFETLGYYSFASCNAWNFWSLMRLNMTDTSELWLFGLTIRSWGNIIIICIMILFVLLVLYGKKMKNSFPVMAAMIIIPVFTFWTAMHERYLFSGLVLLLLSYVYSKHRGFLYFYAAFSFLHLINVWQVYADLMTTYFGGAVFGKHPVEIMLFISAATVIATIGLYVFVFGTRRPSGDL